MVEIAALLVFWKSEAVRRSFPLRAPVLKKGVKKRQRGGPGKEEQSSGGLCNCGGGQDPKGKKTIILHGGKKRKLEGGWGKKQAHATTTTSTTPPTTNQDRAVRLGDATTRDLRAFRPQSSQDPPPPSPLAGGRSTAACQGSNDARLRLRRRYRRLCFACALKPYTHTHTHAAQNQSSVSRLPALPARLFCFKGAPPRLLAPPPLFFPHGIYTGVLSFCTCHPAARWVILSV